MHALLFGERQLYGVYHEPSPLNERDSAILLCSPIGLEYIRSYWALKQLANKLSRAGHHVLRFDYSHTGNSAGASNKVTVENWLEDIKTALKELRALSGIRRYSIVGLRFGALLAASAAESQKLENLILWDPVISGPEHLHALQKLDSQRFNRSQDLTSPDVELLGFPYPSSLKTSIEAQNLIEKKFPDNLQIHCVVSEERPDLLNTLELISASGARIDCTVTADAGHWDEFRSVEDALIVNPILDTIVEKVK